MGNTQTGGRGASLDERDESTPFSKTGYDCRSVFSGHRGAVRCLVPVDSSTVATGADDGEIILWDVHQRVARRRMRYTDLKELDSDTSDDEGGPAVYPSQRPFSYGKPRGRAIQALLPLPELNVLASSSADSNTVVVWSLSTGEQLEVLKGRHKGRITCLVGIPNSSHLLATAGSDAYICLWTAAPAVNSSSCSDIPQAPPLGVGGSPCCVAVLERTSTHAEVALLLSLGPSSFASVLVQSARVHIHTTITNQEQILTAGHDAPAVITHLEGLPDRSEFLTGDDRGRVVVWASSLAPVRTFSLTRLLKLPAKGANSGGGGGGGGSAVPPAAVQHPSSSSELPIDDGADDYTPTATPASHPSAAAGERDGGGGGTGGGRAGGSAGTPLSGNLPSGGGSGYGGGGGGTG
eukprot:Rhum_TRINITY_DN10188_c0_g1::Rhum_TRINITY_DN10188_c0_g1_i1::g.37189::m.37189